MDGRAHQLSFAVGLVGFGYICQRPMRLVQSIGRKDVYVRRQWLPSHVDVKRNGVVDRTVGNVLSFAPTVKVSRDHRLIFRPALIDHFRTLRDDRYHQPCLGNGL